MPQLLALSFQIEWHQSDAGVVYIAGGEELGCAEDGLTRLFGLLRALPSGTQLILRTPLQLACGGQSPQDEFPWKERQAEFNAIVAARRLRIRREYFPP